MKGYRLYMESICSIAKGLSEIMIIPQVNILRWNSWRKGYCIVFGWLCFGFLVGFAKNVEK